MTHRLDPKRPELSLAGLPMLEPDAEAVREALRQAQPPGVAPSRDGVEARLRTLPQWTGDLVILPSRQAAAAPSRRWRWPAGAAVAVAATALLVAVWHLWPEAAGPDLRSLTLTDIRGAPLVFRDRTWQPAPAGLALVDGDQLRTDPGAWAAMDVGRGIRLRIDNRAHLRVKLAGAQGVPTLEILAGRAEGQAGGAGEPQVRFRVNAQVVGLVAGRIGLLHAASGQLAVTALDGPAWIRAAGQQMEIAVGQQLRLGAGNEVPVVEPVGDVTLAWAQQRPIRTSASTVPVEGQIHPGLLLVIQGRPLATDGDGKFVARISRPQAGDFLIARVVDATGRSASHRLPIQQVRSQWRWGTPP